ncbi:sugar kinase [Brunnivagina elsteri]|uniref:Ribokinase n=1 Tax=Brunnivagina elsteri CCALA 953 TaxID=987040 RepID=A0A2A2TBV8_9CYAN|nr:sugar kinase [Calothrix elsteri]PAX51191.1 ribokinase [Calothrix elsteri CCALA 953]
MNGLFIGLSTLDLIYLANSPPENNQKLVALDYTIAAGGPATNAAVTFNHLGNTATILAVVGSHPMTQLIHSDLENCIVNPNHQINLIDLEPKNQNPPPVSSIIVTKTTGERAVISINAVNNSVNKQAIPADVIESIEFFDIVLIDGHQIEVGCEIAKLAKSKNIPVVLDAGSWKPGFEKILPFVDYAICSANFYPPNCYTSEEVFTYLSKIKIPHIAITHGENPIEYLIPDFSSNSSDLGIRSFINVPNIQPVDTLGAGDIFHGAFCHYILREDFPEALSLSAEIAAYSCQFFGTRRWMLNPR